MAAQSSVLQAVRPNGLNDEPQYQLLIDDEKARTLGLKASNSELCATGIFTKWHSCNDN